MNTPSDKVFQETVKDLVYHANFMQGMGLDERYKLVVHVGGTYGDKEYGKENFIHRFYELPQEVQKRITIENDDKSYNCMDVLDLCGKLNVPMILDVHHYHINNIGENLQEVIKKAFNTWNNEYFVPKIHFSSPRSEAEKRAHAEYINEKDFIEFLKIANGTKRKFDVMLEAKAKDLAVLKLRNELIKEGI